MLTKSDLQHITTIVKAENGVLRNELGAGNETLRQGLRSEIKAGNDTLRHELRSDMKRGFSKLEKKLDYAIDFLDRDYIQLLKRVDRIEKHLGII